MLLADQRIVLIGGAGFIGSHIADYSLACGAREVVIFDNLVRGNLRNLDEARSTGRVTLVDGDIRKQAEVRSVLRDGDVVCHLAALWLLHCVEHPRDALDVNVNGTFNVIEACVAAHVRKLVYSSSASVYGNAAFIPMTETHPLNNRTFYGATKIAGEQFLRAFNETHALPYITLRYMNVYGPRQDYKGAYVSVIMKVLDRIEAGLRPIIYGDGSQAYDFVFVRDVARANVKAMTTPTVDKEINVGTGIRTSINELVELISKLAGSRVRPEHRPGAEEFVTDRVGSTARAQELLNFVAETTLADGLKELIDWRAADKAR